MISQKSRRVPVTRKNEPTVVIIAEQEEELCYSDAELNELHHTLSPASPLFEEIIPFLKEEAYVMLRDKENILRQWHVGCQSSQDTRYLMRNAKIKYATQNRVISIDVSAYPSVAEDREWEYYVKKACPEVRECACSLKLFMKDSRTFKRENMTLPRNYFYLTGLNACQETLVFPCQIAKSIRS